MKRIFAALFFVCWFASSVQASTAKEDKQVVPPPQSYAEPSSPTIGEVKSMVNKLLASSRKKTDAALDQKMANSINEIKTIIDQNSSDIAKKVDESAITLNNQLTGKDGEFEKMTSQILSVSKKTNLTIAHWVGWMTFWIILIIILVVGIATYFIRRHFIRVEKGMKAIKKRAEDIHIKNDVTLAAIESLPAKTAEHVHAFFDRKPLEIFVAGHKIIFNQDEEVLNRNAYQILLVECPITTAEKYELQEVSDRKKAVDSLKRTMREYFNGILAAKSDPASNLTLDLIKYFVENKKLIIS